MFQFLQKLSLSRAQNNSIKSISTSKELAEVLLGGVVSASGIRVSPEQAMGIAAIQAGVRFISETIGQLPIVLYKGGKDDQGRDKKDPARDHDLWKILTRKPNGFMTSQQFRETLSMHTVLYGNGYAFKNYVNGRLFELLPLHPKRVQVKQDKDWNIVYDISLPDGKVRTLGRDMIFHVADLSDNGFTGDSRVRKCADTLGLTKAAENYGGEFFKNDATPSGVLSSDKNLNKEDIDKIRLSWAESQHKTKIVDNNFKFEAIATTGEEAQMLETRKFQISEMARILNLPPHVIGDLERASFNNIESQDLALVKYHMMPWFKRWELAVDTQLLDESDQDDHFTKIKVQGLLRGDTKARGTFYQTMRQNKIMSANEVRELEDLNPIDGGDVYENPNTSTTTNTEDDNEDPKDPENSGTDTE